MSTMITQTTSLLTRADHLARWGARVGWRRNDLHFEPGLYTMGAPTPQSPVFVTANYKLSFDALRSALVDMDAYLLVLDTQGINVWCAAGKGTFGTDELVHRLELCRLSKVVDHKHLILPQLGAPGVSAHQVRQRTGFTVEYGPVRAQDLPEYLRTGIATDAMRQVRFDLRDRLALIPIELVHNALAMLLAGIALGLAHGPLAAIAAVTSILGGTVLFPILLPWLPTRDFTSKGWILGCLLALVFALVELLHPDSQTIWQRVAWAAGYLLALPPVTAYLALLFTGSTTFTSRTGVKREMRQYIPWLIVLFLAGLGLAIAMTIVQFRGG